MCALRGPVPYTRPRRTRTIEPPATPTTRTSTLRRAVAWEATRTYDSAGRPWRMAAMLVDVPPTSMTTASVMPVYLSAPATDADGPEYSVRTGAALNPARSVAPPSERITITGAVMPAARTPSATKEAVLMASGRIDAFSAAVTVRSSRP